MIFGWLHLMPGAADQPSSEGVKTDPSRTLPHHGGRAESSSEGGKTSATLRRMGRSPFLLFVAIAAIGCGGTTVAPASSGASGAGGATSSASSNAETTSSASASSTTTGTSTVASSSSSAMTCPGGSIQLVDGGEAITL